MSEFTLEVYTAEPDGIPAINKQGEINMSEFTQEELDEALDGTYELECGCVVEIDGECPCGNASPFLDFI
jgi:hypothetical protein